MNIDTMLSQILYCLSGFLFGIFASRYSVISWRTLASRPPLLQCAPYVLFIIAAFTLFPFWLITRTEAGGFIYYAIPADTAPESTLSWPINMYSRWRKYSRF